MELLDQKIWKFLRSLTIFKLASSQMLLINKEENKTLGTYSFSLELLQFMNCFIHVKKIELYSYYMCTHHLT